MLDTNFESRRLMQGGGCWGGHLCTCGYAWFFSRQGLQQCMRKCEWQLQNMGQLMHVWQQAVACMVLSGAAAAWLIYCWVPCPDAAPRCCCAAAVLLSSLLLQNFFDAGSCIDGRLTSAWNWCSKVEKKVRTRAG